MKEMSILKLSKEALCRAIDEHDIIVFSFMDVLYSGKMVLEKDIVPLLETTVKRRGISVTGFAEERKHAISSGMCLKDIYISLGHVLKIPNTLCDELCQIELDCWQKLIYRREELIECLHYAELMNKKILICHEGFFEESFIRKLLGQLHISEKAVEVIFETDVANMLAAERQESGQECKKLWITDNVVSIQDNIDRIYIKTPLELFQDSPYGEVLPLAKSINDRMIIARIVSRFFSNPFQEYGEGKKPIICSIEDYAYLFIAPFVSAFMVWFIEYIGEGKFDKILFSARDGYLIQNLYHEAIQQLDLRNMPADEYFQISRTLCVAATVYSAGDIENYARVRYALGPEQMLRRRFGLVPSDILPYDEEKYKSVIEYALAHESRILERSSEIRKYYCEYIKKLGLDENKRYALFDFVSSGTCQLLLSKIKHMDVQGVYFCRYFPGLGITNYTSAEEKYALPIDAYITNRSTTEKESYFFSNYNFLEILMTSYSPSVASMDADGPVFDREQRTEEELEIVRKIHECIQKYFAEFLDIWADSEELSFELVDKIFSLQDSEYSEVRCAFLDDCELIEDFGQGRIKIKRR